MTTAQKIFSGTCHLNFLCGFKFHEDFYLQVFYFAIVLPLGQMWDLRPTKFSTNKLVHKNVHIPPASKVFQAFQDLHLHSKHQSLAVCWWILPIKFELKSVPFKNYIHWWAQDYTSSNMVISNTNQDLKICIGNNTISRAIWCRFDVKCKLLSPVRQKQFVVFEKFASVYYTKLLKKSCYLLIMCVKKTSQRVKTNKILKVWACYL